MENFEEQNIGSLPNTDQDNNGRGYVQNPSHPALDPPRPNLDQDDDSWEHYFVYSESEDEDEMQPVPAFGEAFDMISFHSGRPVVQPPNVEYAQPAVDPPAPVRPPARPLEFNQSESSKGRPEAASNHSAAFGDV